VAGAVALAALAFCAWLPALWSGFVADDFLDLTVAKRWRGLGWAFGHDTSPLGGNAHFYRPLWMAWNAGLHDLLGGDAAVYHVVNLVLFSLITIEVWLLARRLAGERAAWIAGAAFAVYPRHGESVAWVTGSTDLTATALVLAALLCLLAPARAWARVPVAAALAAGAALLKEVAFVLPVLAFLLAWTAPSVVAPERRRRLAAAAAITIAQLGVLVARTSIVHGVGGYSEYPWRPARLLLVAASYVLAAVSPPQLELTRHPVLLLFPLLALGFLAWRIRGLRRAGDPRLRLVLVGGAWFVVSLGPAINIAIDLNNASGERLLFLPSVGLALVLAGILDFAPRTPVVIAGVAAAALCLWAASDWLTAGQIAGRVVRQAVALGPQGGELVLLTEPETYRTALVFPAAIFLDAAAERRRRPDLTTSFCIQMQLRAERRGQVRIRPLADGWYDARTKPDAAFDVPVLRTERPLSPDCPYDAGSAGWHLGITTAARARPTPARQPAVLSYFDGRDLLRLG
jgi:hypothetical protein